MTERRFSLFADFHQFLIRDNGADWSDLSGKWTADAIQRMVVEGDGYVGIGTVRDLMVPVTVRILEEAPQGEDSTWDRFETATIRSGTGRLVVMGITDNGASGGIVGVEPGTYCVRIAFGGLNTLTPDGLQGNDSYLIELWPARADGVGAIAPAN